MRYRTAMFISLLHYYYGKHWQVSFFRNIWRLCYYECFRFSSQRKQPWIIIFSGLQTQSLFLQQRRSYNNRVLNINYSVMNFWEVCKNTKNTLYEKILPSFRRKGFCEVPKKFPMLWKAWFSSGFSRDLRVFRKSLKRRKTLGKSGKLSKAQEKEQKLHFCKNFNFGTF